MNKTDINKLLAHRLRRNEVKNLCRRKGFRLTRFWSRFYKQWHYRTEPLRGQRERVGTGLEYCNTHVSALRRVFVHMHNKTDLCTLTAKFQKFK